MRFNWIVATLVALVFAVHDVRAAEKLDGRYVGIEEAKGAVIEIHPDPEGYTGTFFDRHGQSQEFLADAIGEGAAAVLDMDGRTVLLRMTPHEHGAQVTLVPIDKTGKLLAGSATILAFLREGAKIPPPPEGLAEPPPENCTRIAAYSFMVSYEFWEPRDVMNGYSCLPERAQTILTFFPAVRLDIIWRICQSPRDRTALAKALRRSSVSCKSVLAGFASMKNRGRVTAFQQEVRNERKSLIMSIRCAEGYPETKVNCRAAANLLSAKAAEARTPAMVLQNYR